jgi:hypothetical protein
VNRNRPLLYRPQEGDALAGIVVQQHPIHFVLGESRCNDHFRVKKKRRSWGWSGDHLYRWLENAFSAKQKRALAQSPSIVDPADPIMDDEGMADSKGTTSDEVPMVFVLQMRVSGGTYVPSLVHDLALALGSAGHVATLTRSRQKDFVLEPNGGGRLQLRTMGAFEAALEDPLRSSLSLHLYCYY